MNHVEKRGTGDQASYSLHGRVLHNGDRLLVRLYGNAGWQEVEVAGLPLRLEVRFTADDGKQVVTSLSERTEVRWSDETPEGRAPRRQPAVD